MWVCVVRVILGQGLWDAGDMWDFEDLTTSWWKTSVPTRFCQSGIYGEVTTPGKKTLVGAWHRYKKLDSIHRGPVNESTSKSILSSVCWSPSAKPGNEAECRIYGGWVKSRSSFKPFVGQSSWHFGTMYETPYNCQRTWPIVYIMFHSKDISRANCR